MKQKICFLLAMLFCITLQTMAQTDGDNPEDREVDMDTPTFEPMVKVGKVLLDHDSVQYVQVNNVYVYPQPVFKNAKERMAYNRLVYNIKKVLPIAKEVRKIIIETGDYLETLPNKKAKDAHMKLVEKGIKQKYSHRTMVKTAQILNFFIRLDKMCIISPTAAKKKVFFFLRLCYNCLKILLYLRGPRFSLPPPPRRYRLCRYLFRQIPLWASKHRSSPTSR